MRIAVYCTGGTKLGFGHYFRSKAFVKAAPKDVEVLLVPVGDAENFHLFNEVKQITAPCLDEEAALSVITRFSPEIVIFDTVFCSDAMFERIRAKTRVLVSISPVFNQMTKIDYLFTRNINADPIPNVKVFKGLEYIVFNETCTAINDEAYFRTLSREYLTVGIAMGGGDAPNKTLRVLQAISRLESPCTFWVLLGEGYKHSYQELVSSIRNDSHHEIILAKTNRSMWNVLSNCAVAVLAGGLTTLEAVYAGLPTLNFFEKSEHLLATGKQLFELGTAEDLGVFGGDSLSVLPDRLKYYLESKSQLLQMRERSKGKIDKLGPYRIFDALRNLK